MVGGVGLQVVRVFFVAKRSQEQLGGSVYRPKRGKMSGKIDALKVSY